MAKRRPGGVERTIRDGAVRIYGRTFRPNEHHMAYDGRCDGLRYWFGLYFSPGSRWDIEPFVCLHSLAESTDESVMDGPHCVDGGYPWEWWDTHTTDAPDTTGAE